MYFYKLSLVAFFVTLITFTSAKSFDKRSTDTSIHQDTIDQVTHRNVHQKREIKNKSSNSAGLTSNFDENTSVTVEDSKTYKEKAEFLRKNKYEQVKGKGKYRAISKACKDCNGGRMGAHGGGGNVGDPTVKVLTSDELAAACKICDTTPSKSPKEFERFFETKNGGTYVGGL